LQRFDRTLDPRPEFTVTEDRGKVLGELLDEIVHSLLEPASGARLEEDRARLLRLAEVEDEADVVRLLLRFGQPLDKALDRGQAARAGQAGYEHVEANPPHRKTKGDSLYRAVLGDDRRGRFDPRRVSSRKPALRTPPDQLLRAEFSDHDSSFADSSAGNSAMPSTAVENAPSIAAAPTDRKPG